MSERIGLKDHARRAAQIAGRNFLDEGGDVDVCRAGEGAGGVVTEETLVRFEQRVVVRQRRRDIREVALELVVRENGGLLTHPSPAPPAPPAGLRPLTPVPPRWSQP